MHAIECAGWGWRRRCGAAWWVLAVFAIVGVLSGTGGVRAAGRTGLTRIPVILDTDIGDDIDDTWALAFLLRSPELDLKLVLTDSGDTVYRARLAARLIEGAGRTDVPVGIGIRQADGGGRQGEWIKDYDLARYPGRVYDDGVAALVELIRSSPQPVTLVAIGPAPNLRAALQRAPDIARRARFVGMYGSVRAGYDGRPTPEAEWNVKRDPEAVRAIFGAAWEATITPLDTCGRVRLKGEKYAAVRDARDPLTQAVIANYRLWLPHADWLPKDSAGLADRESTILFDTVAVYLAFSERLVGVESLGLRVTDDGWTLIDPGAKSVRCATEWKDLAAFEDLLVSRLTSGAGAKRAD
jgi:inosine-uridine nucleoside N-ribohydrolase